MPHPAPQSPNKSNHASAVKIDPDNLLPHETVAKFNILLKDYDAVFDLQFKGYNGAARPFKAKVKVNGLGRTPAAERTPPSLCPQETRGASG